MTPSSAATVRALLAPVFFATLSTACSAGFTGRRAEPAVYTVTDTMAYENSLAEGTFGVLRRNGAVIDSIDLDFGFHRIAPTAAVFLPVEAYPSEDTPPFGIDITEHVLFDGTRRVPLNTFLPHFEDYFSSPSVVDGRLYYWGLDSVGVGEYNLRAHRYDFREQRLDSTLLHRAEVATDARFHFPPPFCAAGRIVYDSRERIYLLDRHLRITQTLPGGTQGDYSVPTPTSTSSCFSAP